MTIRRRIGTFLAATALTGTIAGPTFAADNGAVDATVTVATPCILVTPSQVDFGTLPFSPLGAPTSSGLAAVSYTNCADIPERVYARGSDATGSSPGGPITWTLTPAPACGSTTNPILNEYTVATVDGVNPAKPLSGADLELETVAAASQGAVNQLAILMPCAGSDGAGSLMSFQVTFTATF
jgi:hypothetical protein